jgi:hypothetical protein
LIISLAPSKKLNNVLEYLYNSYGRSPSLLKPKISEAVSGGRNLRLIDLLASVSLVKPHRPTNETLSKISAKTANRAYYNGNW